MAGTLSADAFAIQLNPQSRNAENASKFVREWMESRTDPSSKAPGMPPNYGQDAVPHLLTFQSLVGTYSRAYISPDEAIRDSIENAHLMRKDIGILECIENRQRLTALLQWEIKPEDEKNVYQVSLANELTRMISRISQFTQYKHWLMDAIWTGRSGIQHKYGYVNINGRQRLIPTGGDHLDHNGWMPVNGDKIVFRYDDGFREVGKDDPNVYAHQMGLKVSSMHGNQESRIGGHYNLEPIGDAMAVFLKPWERDTFIVHKHYIEDADFHYAHFAGSIHGIGIRSRIYWEWYLKQQAFAFLMQYLERSAGGIEVWTYPSGDDKALAAVQKAASEKMANGRNMVFFPKPLGEDAPMYDFQVIEPGAMGLDIIQSIVERYFGGRLKRYILGQELSTESHATGLGSGVADAHMDTLSQIVQFDANNLEDTITRQLVRYLQRINFPETLGWHMQFKLKTKDDKVQERLDSLNAAYQMGCGIPESEVFKSLGIASPRAGEKVLSIQTQQQSMMPGMIAGQAPAGGPPQEDEEKPDLSSLLSGLSGEQYAVDGDKDLYGPERKLFDDGRKTQQKLYKQEHWITVHPNGPDSEGQPVLISGDGRIKAGMGGKFNGQHLHEAVSKSKEEPKPNFALDPAQSEQPSQPEPTPAPPEPPIAPKRRMVGGDPSKMKPVGTTAPPAPVAAAPKPEMPQLSVEQPSNEPQQSPPEHGSQNGNTPTQTVLSAIKQAAPDIINGGMAQISDIRKNLSGKMSQEDADRVLWQLAADGKLALHRFDRPMLLPEERRNTELLRDPDDPNFYVNVVSAWINDESDRQSFANLFNQPQSPMADVTNSTQRLVTADNSKQVPQPTAPEQKPPVNNAKRDQLVSDNYDLVKLAVRSMAKWIGRDRDEAESAAQLALMEAAEQWDESKGTPFRPFAMIGMKRVLKNSSRLTKDRRITQNVSSDEDGNDPLQNMAGGNDRSEHNEKLNLVRDALDSHQAKNPADTEREKALFMDWFTGIQKSEGMNQAHFAQKHGYNSAQAAKHVVDRILQSLQDRIIYEAPTADIGKDRYEAVRWLVTQYSVAVLQYEQKERYERRLNRVIREAADKTHPEPSDEQVQAGNYRKGSFRWNGMRFVIENPVGSTRRGVSDDGKVWKNTMSAHYGYISGTTGSDGDQLDAFMGKTPESDLVFVVSQIDQKTGQFDEEKVILGCTNEKQAKSLYLSHYPSGWKCGEIKAMPIGQFKQWLNGECC
jgi:DNA-directed RNA polymerase specialized sigma subunit